MGLKAKDPLMDGPIITGSMQRSIGAGAVGEAIETARRIRNLERALPGILFCYPETQVRQADAEWSEFDAVLCLDSDEGAKDEIAAHARNRGTRIVEAVPYEFGDTDIDRARAADAYVMLQYTRGRTGLRPHRDPHLAERLSRLRNAGIDVPIVVGIGLSGPDQVRDAMDQGADGVVIGSKTVQAAELSNAAVEDYLSAMREALDHG